MSYQIKSNVQSNQITNQISNQRSNEIKNENQIKSKKANRINNQITNIMTSPHHGSWAYGTATSWAAICASSTTSACSAMTGTAGFSQLHHNFQLQSMGGARNKWIYFLYKRVLELRNHSGRKDFVPRCRGRCMAGLIHAAHSSSAQIRVPPASKILVNC